MKLKNREYFDSKQNQNACNISEFDYVKKYLEQGILPPLNRKLEGGFGIDILKNGWT